jgi:hypothetical protein
MEAIIVGTVCVIWIGLTIIAQFNNRLSKNIQQSDKLGLVPRWTFFAPIPGSTDVHLLIRYKINGEVSSWHETKLTVDLSKRLKWKRWIFNPYRRVEKLLFDFVNDTFSLKEQVLQIKYSTDYILILRFSENIATQLSADEVQFMIAGSNLTLLKDLEVFMTSDTHRIR